MSEVGSTTIRVTADLDGFDEKMREAEQRVERLTACVDELRTALDQAAAAWRNLDLIARP